MRETDLYKPECFDARFLKHLESEDTTLQEAWERTEADFKRVFGHRKYANYESYRRSRRRRIKR